MSGYNPLNQTSYTAAPGQPMPQWEDAFRQGTCALFKRWTVIQMCVAQEWAGHQTKQMINSLVEQIFEAVLGSVRKNKPMTAASETDIEHLAEFLRIGLYEKCNAESEDDSDLEISKVVLQLFDACRRNDFSLAGEMVRKAEEEENARHHQKAQGAGLALSQVRDDTQYIEADPDNLPGNLTWCDGQYHPEEVNQAGNGGNNPGMGNGGSNVLGNAMGDVDMDMDDGNMAASSSSNPNGNANTTSMNSSNNNVNQQNAGQQQSFPFSQNGSFANHMVFAPQQGHVNNAPREKEIDDDGFEMVRKKR